VDVRDDLTMNDFLREHLGMTGTKFGCGAAQCLSCGVIVDNPDGTITPARPASFRPQASMARRSARSKAMRRTASFPPCKKLSSSTSPFSAAIARQAS
jgi:hypothetical protein